MMDSESLFPARFSYFDPSPSRIQVWMNGGGTQSSAIAALICQEVLPKPDIAMLINTGREKSSTFEYYHSVVRPAMEKMGVRCVVVDKSDYATVDLTSKNGKHLLIPAFTDKSGRVGKLTNYCSKEWKLRSKQRWLREKGVKSCDTWLGISIDEIRRVRSDSVKWDRTLYPLIHLRKRRMDCKAIVLSMGWPSPPRSACWMCPNQCATEWRDLHDNYPDDFAKAVAMDSAIRQSDPNAFLHESCVPLDSVDFSSPTVSSGYESGCDTGMCFV